MINDREFDRLYRQNCADKHALDMLDELRDAYMCDTEIQDEVLRVKEKFEIPTGGLGPLCNLVDDLREKSEQMYVLWYKTFDANALSDEVFKVIAEVYDDLNDD